MQDSVLEQNLNTEEAFSQEESFIVNHFFESFLLFITSLSLCFSILFMFSDLLNVSAKTYSLSLFDIGLQIIVCLIYNFYFNHTASDKTSRAGNIRFLILFLILTSIVYFFLKSFINPFAFFISAIFMFFYMGEISEPFNKHNLFLDQCNGKTGKTLFNELYADKFNGEDFLKSIKKYKNLLAIPASLLVFLSIILNLGDFSFSIKTTLCIILHLFCVYLNYALMGIFKKETYFAFMGYDRVFHTKLKNLCAVFVIFFICLGFGIIFSSNHSLFNLKNFLSWFNFIRVEKPVPRTPDPIPEINLDSPVMPVMDFSPIQNTSNAKVAEIILIVLQVILITIISAFIVIFLFKPFFSKEFRQFLKERKFRKVFNLFLENFRVIIKKIFHFRFKKSKYAKADSEDFTENINSFIKKSKKSRENKLELDRLTAQFVKLLDWGNKNQILYKKNYAPIEYTNLIAERFLEKGMSVEQNAVHQCGVLFEKALYSSKLLTDLEEKKFSESINCVISVNL